MKQIQSIVNKIVSVKKQIGIVSLCAALVIAVSVGLLLIPSEARTTGEETSQVMAKANQPAIDWSYTAKPPSMEDWLAFMAKLAKTEEAKKEAETKEKGTGAANASGTGGGSGYGGGVGSLGNVGRLVIPGLGISVALNADSTQGQPYVDAQDSAWYWQHSWRGHSVIEILDHCDQAFASLSGSYVGLTGTIYYHGYAQPIVCIDVRPGTSTLTNRFVNGVEVRDYYSGAIVMSTCMSDCYNVLLSVWVPGSYPISVAELQRQRDQASDPEPATSKPKPATPVKPAEKPTQPQTQPESTQPETTQPETTPPETTATEEPVQQQEPEASDTKPGTGTPDPGEDSNGAT